MADFTKFEPSKNQRAVLAAFQETNYACTIGEACTSAGVTRQAYYNWHEEPDFSQWWREQAERHFSLQIGRVHEAALSAATSTERYARGSAADRKLLLERFDKGYCPKTQAAHEVTGPGGSAIPIQIVMFGQPPDTDTDTDGEPAAE